MNKKILVGIAIAVIIVSVGIIGAKAMLGDKATELPGEEKVEKTLNIEEGKGTTELGESGENEANENEP
jgi:cell division protein YceG involved in septum cleavage